MARKRAKTKTGQAVTDYRHEDAKRVNIPSAGLAAQGKISEKPKSGMPMIRTSRRSFGLIAPGMSTACQSFLRRHGPAHDP
jgi:hypothetical protein